MRRSQESEPIGLDERRCLATLRVAPYIHLRVRASMKYLVVRRQATEDFSEVSSTSVLALVKAQHLVEEQSSTL